MRPLLLSIAGSLLRAPEPTGPASANPQKKNQEPRVSYTYLRRNPGIYQRDLNIYVQPL